MTILKLLEKMQGGLETFELFYTSVSANGKTMQLRVSHTWISNTLAMVDTMDSFEEIEIVKELEHKFTDFEIDWELKHIVIFW